MNEQQEKEFSQMSHLQKLIIQIEMMIEQCTPESVPCLEEELKYYLKQENPLYFRGFRYGVLLSLRLNIIRNIMKKQTKPQENESEINPAEQKIDPAVIDSPELDPNLPVERLIVIQQMIAKQIEK